MRTAVMLRALDEKGRVGVYTRNIVEELLRIDQHNAYVFFYKTAANVGRYVGHQNVTERLVAGRDVERERTR